VCGLRSYGRGVASVRTCNRSRRQKAAPSTEQSGEGGAGNFGRRPAGGLPSVASEIQKSYKDSPRDDLRVKREGKERCTSVEEPSAPVRGYFSSRMVQHF
jgi:hypothetical protein